MTRTTSAYWFSSSQKSLTARKGKKKQETQREDERDVKASFVEHSAEHQGPFITGGNHRILSNSDIAENFIWPAK
jgi:hypothetical protein